ncbi:MAG: hypothetical protein ACR2JW_11610 [Thermomicrobiales bacterium]
MVDFDGRVQRYRLCVVNGVFVSGGVGDDGRVQPPHLFTALAERLAEATGWRAWALWPYRDKRVFGVPAFATTTRRAIEGYARFLADAIRADLNAAPLESGESLAFVAYSGGVPVVQTAATLLRPSIPVEAFVFFGPALLPGKVPADWAGSASVGCVLGERDWIQGVYPRLPRPWHGALHARNHARIVAALPANTVYRTIPCDHWPGYFTQEGSPLLVSAICDLLQPVAVRGLRRVGARSARPSRARAPRA